MLEGKEKEVSSNGQSEAYSLSIGFDIYCDAMKTFLLRTEEMLQDVIRKMYTMGDEGGGRAIANGVLVMSQH